MMKFHGSFVSIFMILNGLGNAEEICSEEICIPANYSKSIMPKKDNVNEIVLILTDIQIIDVNDFKSTITMNLKMSLFWEDPRITPSANLTRNWEPIGTIHH